MRLPEETIAAIVKDAAALHLGVGERLARVRARRDVDEGGEPIVWVDLLFTDDPLRLDPRRTVSLPHCLVERLDAASEDAFPVVSYLSRSDWDEADLAAE